MVVENHPTLLSMERCAVSSKFVKFYLLRMDGQTVYYTNRKTSTMPRQVHADWILFNRFLNYSLLGAGDCCFACQVIPWYRFLSTISVSDSSGLSIIAASGFLTRFIQVSPYYLHQGQVSDPHLIQECSQYVCVFGVLHRQFESASAGVDILCIIVGHR